MPRRTPDTGVKPFEVRTGIGGVPVFGGMYRSGDPATIPPHKFHFLANMRNTPQGLISRPGLDLVFNTGVQECINGLTEDAGLQGGSILLFPGALPGSNGATLRAIFPDSSIDYSEFAFVLYGPASQSAARSPVVGFYDESGMGNDAPHLSKPFIFRGQVCEFAMAKRNGVPTVALVGWHLAGRSFKQAVDCWRNELAGGTGCAAVTIGATWPFNHPVGSAQVLVYFDNPFNTAAAWTTDTGDYSVDVLDSVLTRPERIDNPLDGTPGVNEVLYFVAKRGAGPVERVLVRWDGVKQSTEAVSIPNDLRPSLGDQINGPFLGHAAAAASPGDWSAYKKADGTWATSGGYDFVEVDSHFLEKGLSWGGIPQVAVYGNGPGAQFNGFFRVHRQDATGFNTLSATLIDFVETQYPVAFDAVVAGNLIYAVTAMGSVTGDETKQRYLQVGNFLDPTNPVGYALAAPGILLSTSQIGTPPRELWIQNIGGRVYVGGHFTGWNPATAAADVDYHGVFDVTDPTAIFAVYRVADTDQLGDTPSQRYSRGALAAVPNDDNGGQGFQAS